MLQNNSHKKSTSEASAQECPYDSLHIRQVFINQKKSRNRERDELGEFKMATFRTYATTQVCIVTIIFITRKKAHVLLWAINYKEHKNDRIYV